MREIKEVIVYSNGDSNDLSTWSNVVDFKKEKLGGAIYYGKM